MRALRGEARESARERAERARELLEAAEQRKRDLVGSGPWLGGAREEGGTVSGARDGLEGAWPVVGAGTLERTGPPPQPRPGATKPAAAGEVGGAVKSGKFKRRPLSCASLGSPALVPAPSPPPRIVAPLEAPQIPAS